MPHIVRNLTPLQATSAGSPVTNGIGHLDDATTICLFVTSSAGGVISGSVIQVSQFDPADNFPLSGVTQSSAWFTMSTAIQPVPVTSSGISIPISQISFRGLRISGLSSSTVAADVIAWVSKQVSV